MLGAHYFLNGLNVWHFQSEVGYVAFSLIVNEQLIQKFKAQFSKNPLQHGMKLLKVRKFLIPRLEQ